MWGRHTAFITIITVDSQQESINAMVNGTNTISKPNHLEQQQSVDTEGEFFTKYLPDTIFSALIKVFPKARETKNLEHTWHLCKNMHWPHQTPPQLTNSKATSKHCSHITFYEVTNKRISFLDYKFRRIWISETRHQTTRVMENYYPCPTSYASPQLSKDGRCEYDTIYEGTVTSRSWEKN